MYLMNEPGYYAILPASVRYDNNLKPMEKILFSEITALSNKRGYCNASNTYFSGLYSVKKETVSRWINKLLKNGYIEIKMIYFEGTKQVEERRLTPLTKKSIPPRQKDQYPIDKKVNGNNTRDNITSNNKRKSKPKRKCFVKPTSEQVQEYLDEKQNRTVNADQFIDHYDSNGWMIGKTQMKDWKAAVRNWIRNESKYGKRNKTKYEQREDAIKQNLERAAAIDEALESDGYEVSEQLDSSIPF